MSFYCVDDREMITCETIEDAVAEWLEDQGLDGVCSDDLPAFVVVNKFERQVVKPTTPIFDWALEALIDNLDENYGAEETNGDYTPSGKAKALWGEFVTQVISEYPVSQLMVTGSYRVPVGDHL